MSIEKGRRNMLKFGLAGVAGMAAGHSLLKSNAFAAGTMLQVSIPTLNVAAGGLTPASRVQALDALAPVLAGISEAAGMKLNSTQLAALRTNLASRGVIQLPSAGVAASVSVSSLSLDFRASGMVR